MILTPTQFILIRRFQAKVKKIGIFFNLTLMGDEAYALKTIGSVEGLATDLDLLADCRVLKDYYKVTPSEEFA